jgi:hypothetical protein
MYPFWSVFRTRGFAALTAEKQVHRSHVCSSSWAACRCCAMCSLFVCASLGLLFLYHQPAVAQPCCEEKTDFGLEFLRPCAFEETLPWLSEHMLCLCCAVFLLSLLLFIASPGLFAALLLYRAHTSLSCCMRAFTFPNITSHQLL